ncbi:hypothetical protein BGW38_009742 [Lunasporangiospora selenospora]|uniref:DUF4187 domain-containing protein n=1 Tax=Lunasporangiospora selenospora TaxID=979761 RepID=A0A9P6KG17_9FUNG|nr:hypothetical protein BGW38_009742 [Lunasporangiospora selenospora]
MSDSNSVEDEEDYMSEAFLDNLVKGHNEKEKKDVTPTYSQRRRQKELEHLANLPKKRHVLEKEAREKGLDTAIADDNKGMAMLLKMGFKQAATDTEITNDDGSKNAQAASEGSDSSTVLRVPLEIQVRQGRGGLGLEMERKRHAEEDLQRQEEKTRRIYDEEFRGQKNSEFLSAKWKRQLGAAVSICMRLDVEKATKAGFTSSNQLNTTVDAEHAISLCKSKRDCSGEIGGSSSAYTKGMRFGRSNSFWWIADSVPDEELGSRLMGPCAGADQDILSAGTKPENSDHGDRHTGSNKRVKLDNTGDGNEGRDAEDIPPRWGERPDFAQLNVDTKLDQVVQYLRHEHFYCFWCSAKYDGPEDLTENCPGELEDDH